MFHSFSDLSHSSHCRHSLSPGVPRSVYLGTSLKDIVQVVLDIVPGNVVARGLCHVAVIVESSCRYDDPTATRGALDIEHLLHATAFWSDCSDVVVIQLPVYTLSVAKLTFNHITCPITLSFFTLKAPDNIPRFVDAVAFGGFSFLPRR